MATLAELYEFLETKQDDSHLDSRFSYDVFLPVEQPKARLEILTWWKIERLIAYATKSSIKLRFMHFTEAM